MRKPNKVMVMRDLQEALWQAVAPQIALYSFTAVPDNKIVQSAIESFVKEQARCCSMAELADALYAIEETMAAFLEYLRSRGIAGDPVKGTAV
ncbi:MAG: hypothetical protein JRJ12_00695 [Deltaproteobacteria bacterium]|nr:hypothetical protein [Deltaproteobacteria bacterium]MBW2071472.1 hypothetical protein [Deltaproteobacteria bacterium]